MAITQKTMAAIKAAPLSVVIESTGASLKRVGYEFLTQCLWHEDTNPSLTISDQKGFCFCHVCREGGDAMDYLQKALGVGLRDAAEHAAKVLNIPFETDDEDPEVRAKRKAARQRILDGLKAEQETYRNNLKDKRATRIQGILKDRGLTPAASREFELGFAASGPFTGRITVPILNHYGELVGWTGRATKEDQPAKYKNSETSDVFDKKMLVFNEQRAVKASKEAGGLIFVEGHLDVIAMWQAGIRNVVAAQGTGAPDPVVLKRLARATKNITLCFDGDAGGRKAAEQFISVAGPMAMAGEMNINVVTLPEGMDPDELIRSGQDLYHYIASAPSWLDWIIDHWAGHLDKNDTAMITEVEDRLRKLINGLRSNTLRAHYIDRAARVLSVDDKEAASLASSWATDDYHHEGGLPEWQCRSPHEIRLAVERRMLRIFVHRPEKRPELRPLLEQVQNPALVWLSERLRELEQYSTVDLTPHSVMALVACSEPHYLQQLRTLIRPNVIIDDSIGVLEHICGILGEGISSTPDATDSD